MTGTFGAGIDKLLEQTPRQTKGVVEVNQIYAHYQHEGLAFHHPDGGEALYLKTPLFAKAREYLVHIASTAIGKDGVGIIDGMADQMEDLSREVYERAPLEFGDLKGSGHPYVVADGTIVRDRPPNVERLEDFDLKAKAKLRYLFGRGSM